MEPLGGFSSTRLTQQFCSSSNQDWTFHYEKNKHTLWVDGLTTLKYELISVAYEEKYGGYIHIIFEPRTPLLGGQVTKIL